MERAKTVEQYIDLVKQAVFEVEELRLAMEYDMDSMSGAGSFIDELEQQIKSVYQGMEQGTYQFANEDLTFMGYVLHVDERLLPFKHLLYLINETHRQGLDVDED
jgi:hypothetical protein